MKKLRSGLPLFLLLCYVSMSLSAQETISIKVPNHGYPVIQTLTPEQMQKSINAAKANPPKALTSSVYGSLPSGSMATPSPEVGSINRFKDVPVNFFTGTSIIPVPLYTLEEAGISVPISLNYNASGMKTHEVAGWTGIGWNLVAGGMITREVRGVPDEGKLDLKSNSWTSSDHRKGYYWHGMNSNFRPAEDDTEPDVFYLNINGQSYKFMYKYSGVSRFIFFPDADIHVEVDFDFLPESNIVGKFVKFTVLMPDGTKYIFGDGNYEKSAEVEVKTAQQLDIYPATAHFNHYMKNEAITSAWYLTRIETPYGSSINFSYDRITYSFFKVAESEATVHCPTPLQVQKQINKVYVNGSALNSITSDHKKIEFNKRLIQCTGTGDEEVCNNVYFGTPRLDIDSWTQNPVNHSYSKKLSEMQVMDNVANPTDTLTYSFDYGYFNEDQAGAELPTGYTSSDVGFSHTKRLRLDKITFPDASNYRFRYRGDSPTYVGKSRLDFGIDHWGYANGSTGNKALTGLIGPDSFFSTCTTSASNRETDPNFAFTGSLDSILISTGVKIKLDYELHQARNYKNGNNYIPIGGCRIKEIRTKDVISNIETVKRYSYLMSDSVRSSGFLCLKPIYRFNNVYFQSGSNSSIYDRLLTESGRPAVGYNHVTEQISDSNGNKLGRTEYFFDQDTTELTIRRIDLQNCTPYPNIVCDTLVYYEPEKAHPFNGQPLFAHSYRLANPVKTIIFNQHNDTLSVQTYTYTNLLYPTLVDAAFGAKIFKTNGYNLGYNTSYNYCEESFYLQFFKYRLESETTKTFSQTGTNPITNTINYTYKDQTDVSYRNNYQGQHNLLTKTATTDGQGHAIEQLNKYVADFSFGLDTLLIERTCTDEYGSYPCDTTEYIIHVPRIGSQMRAIYELQEKHILTPIVESSSTNDGYVLNSQYNRYDKINTTGTGFKYYLKESFALDDVGGTLTHVQYDRPNDDTTYIDFQYHSVIDYQDYNTRGLLKKAKPYGGASAGTDYDGSFDVLPVRSIQNIGGAVIDTTSYEYSKKIFGLSKQISPNKLTVNYSYYTQAENKKTGQLKQITDKDGNILSHYEYPYKGQALLGTAGSFSTDTTKNRVIGRIPRIATNNPYQDFEKVTTSVGYSDGSGRELQSIGYKQSPTAKDLLSGTPQYDAFGRNFKTILPVAKSTGNGQYQTNTQTLAQSFYGDTAPYTEITQFEQSPLSRAFKSIGTGAAFRPNKDGQQQYETGNFGLNKYELSQNGILTVSTYTGNSIFKTTSIDEQQKKTISYSDKTGKTLEEHVQYTGDGSQASHYLKTTYVYDYLGRLALIIPPKLYGVIPNSTTIASSPYLTGIYQFIYDNQSRLVEKHIPDAGWEYMVYNRLGQLVLSQNARLRTENKWLFSKYDASGRVAASGALVNTDSRAILQSSFDNYTESQQYEERFVSSSYTDRSYPAGIVVNETNAMIINYYDDYAWKTNDTLNFAPYKTARYTNAKGLLTGTAVKRLDSGGWLRTAFYYDDKNRLIQTQSENRFGLVNQTDQVYDFIGQLLEERTIYRKPSNTEIESRTVYSYDHAGRKTQATHFLNGKEELLATYDYDELGRLIAKNLNEARRDSIVRQNETTTKGITDVAKKYVLLQPGTVINPDSTYLAFIASGLQKVSYSYNIRGNLRGINLTSTGRLDSSKIFALKLDYFEDSRYYNGNLSRQSWKTSKDTTTRRFLYDYDAANRFTNAAFNGKGNEKYSTNTAYDANGNILTLNRKGLLSVNTWGQIDSLAYSYPNYQNQLAGIRDYASNTIGFKDNGNNTDYTYYNDGSLKSDANKGIDSIRYNYLGLPTHIYFDPDKYIENVYAADGQKLYQKIVNGSSIIRTDYIGVLIYKNDTLISVLHDEGKIRFDEQGLAHYQYFITDHLGNTRVIFEKLNDTLYLAQENHYGVWGELLQGIGTQGDWKFLFQGKEYVGALGLNTYDFHARQYDPFAGRFLANDPKNQFASGYIGMGNMPTIGIDPDGQWIHIAIGAAVGGLVNLGVKAFQGKIHSFKDGAVAFGIGAVAGGVGAATGGAAFFAAGGGTAGAGGFLAGAAGGAVGSATSSPIQGIGNAVYFGDSYKPKDFGRDVLVGGLVGGTINGTIAAFSKTPANAGKNFWTGDRVADGASKFNVRNSTLLRDQGWVRGENGGWVRGYGGDATSQFPDWVDANGVTHEGGTYTSRAPAATSNLDGSFSIHDWSGYPSIGNVPRPTGPFRILTGQEYDAARTLANRTNELLKQQGVFPRGVDIHEIHPVKFGGSPTDIANKIALPRASHSQYTTWWNRLQRNIR
jgi:RHS repeat-associated protein